MFKEKELNLYDIIRDSLVKSTGASVLNKPENTTIAIHVNSLMFEMIHIIIREKIYDASFILGEMYVSELPNAYTITLTEPYQPVLKFIRDDSIKGYNFLIKELQNV